MLASLAPTYADRERLIARLLQRYGMDRRTLIRRLDFLGLKFLPERLGPAALDEHERRVGLYLKTYKLGMQLRRAMLSKVERLRENLQASKKRSYTLREAARVLSVRPEVLRCWIFDLGAMNMDAQGKIPISEVAHFLTSEWKWLLPAKRLLRNSLWKNNKAGLPIPEKKGINASNMESI